MQTHRKQNTYNNAFYQIGISGFKHFGFGLKTQERCFLNMGMKSIFLTNKKTEYMLETRYEGLTRQMS